MHLQRGAPATTMRTGRSAGVETAAGATREEGDCGGERWSAKMCEDRVSMLWTKRNDVGGGGSAPEPFEVGRAAANDEPLAASDENRQAHEIWLDVPLVDAAVTGSGHTLTHAHTHTQTAHEREIVRDEVDQTGGGVWPRAWSCGRTPPSVHRFLSRR